jgi:hypothetical protein
MDLMHESREELKRADHLLYVSLKYTRTVDVIKNIIDRLIAGLTYVIDALLTDAQEKNKLKNIPPQIGLKYELLQKTYKDEMIVELVEFYMKLRKISNAEYKKSNEYRRHVTMTATTETGIISITLEVIKEYYERAVGFADFADNLMNPKKE